MKISLLEVENFKRARHSRGTAARAEHCEMLMQRKEDTTWCDFLPIRFHRPRPEEKCTL